MNQCNRYLIELLSLVTSTFSLIMLLVTKSLLTYVKKYLWENFHGPQSFPATQQKFLCLVQWSQWTVDRIVEYGRRGRRGENSDSPWFYCEAQ